MKYSIVYVRVHGRVFHPNGFRKLLPSAPKTIYNSCSFHAICYLERFSETLVYYMQMLSVSFSNSRKQSSSSANNNQSCYYATKTHNRKKNQTWTTRWIRFSVGQTSWWEECIRCIYVCNVYESEGERSDDIVRCVCGMPLTMCLLFISTSTYTEWKYKYLYNVHVTGNSTVASHSKIYEVVMSLLCSLYLSASRICILLDFVIFVAGPTQSQSKRRYWVFLSNRSYRTARFLRIISMRTNAIMIT